MITETDRPTTGIRASLRWWPLVLVPTLIAVAASIWSTTQQEPSYTATTRLVVIPLAQWDETFIGTSLVRDAGDAARTAATMVARLDSRRAAVAAAEYLGPGWTPDSVAETIEVTVVEETNAIDVTARAADAGRAAEAVEGFVQATLKERWRKISAELDERIAAIAATTSGDPNDGEASARRQTLELIRQGGFDPTLRIDSTGPAVLDEQMHPVLVVLLATAGGLFVGLLAAVAMTRLRPRESAPTVDPSRGKSATGGG